MVKTEGEESICGTEVGRENESVLVEESGGLMGKHRMLHLRARDVNRRSDLCT